MENNNNDIAVIGLSCMMPDANSLEELHQVLSEGRDMVRNLENERIYHSCLKTRNPYQLHGHLSRVDIFDYPFFNISRKEAEAMDPNQRLVLELTVTAMENAGYPISYFRGKQVAVYMAAKAHSTYYDQLDDKDYNAFVGNLQTMLAGRVSHKLDLRGPAITLDTACSSGLVAVHEAISKLLLGEVDYAVAGGVNIESDFFELEANSSGGLGIHSPEGKSRPFDENANGIGGGEGGGVVLLKRLADANADGDLIQAVIKGSAMNQDGHSSNGITAPNADAQTSVLTAAWRRANVAPETITYIEAHGTGTKLGDPIEFSALNDAFKKHTDKTGFCAIGSLKSNYGHLNNAAGIAGLLKAIAALKYRSLYPTVHFNQLNSYISTENTAIFVSDAFRPWESDSPRRCGVSSFGLSGTNVHMVLEESNPHLEVSSSKTPLLLKISAKSDGVLVNYLNVLSGAIPNEKRLPGFLKTFNQGRDDYTFRAAFLAKDSVRLKEKITAYLKKSIGKSFAPVLPSTVVMLLANDCPTDKKIIKTYKTYHAFKDTYEQVLDLGKQKPMVKVLAFQLALIALFKSLGIDISAVVGFGIGKLTKSVVVDNLPLADALDGLDLYEKILTEESRFKLEKAINTMQQNRQVVFIELSQTSKLSSGMTEDVIKKKVFGSLAAESLLCEMYLLGVNLNWGHYYKQLSLSGPKVEAPTYPFERIACGCKNSLAHYTKMVKKWHHQLKWVEQPLLDKSNAKKLEGDFLWFSISGDNKELSLKESGQFLLIQHTTEEKQDKENGFTADLTKRQSISQLRDDIESSRITFDGIVFDASVNSESPYSKKEQMKILQMLFNVAMIFQANFYSSKFLFSIVTGNPNRSDINQHAIARGFDNMLSTFLRSILVDFPKTRMLSIDFKKGMGRENLIKIVSDEIMSENDKYFIQYNGGKRYVQKLIPDAEINEVSAFDASKYLITGGSGGIGLEMACMLSLQSNTKEIILLGRSDLSFLLEDKVCSSLDKREQQIHEKFTFITDNGVKLQYISADVAKRNQLTEKLQEINRLDVLIHCAGANYQNKILADKVWKDVTACLAPKVEGAINLIELCTSIKTKKVLFFSSLNALVPKPNSIEYAMSNAFLDAYAMKLNEQGLNVTSVNWPGWRAVGMGGDRLIKNPDALQDIHVIEGFASMSMAIASNYANTIVANFNKKELGQNPFFLIDMDEEEQEEVYIVAASPEISDTEKSVSNVIEDIWCEVLKMDGVAHDVDFFEIGGHSLNGTQVLNRIADRLGLELELEDLFEYGDIASFANFVENRLEEHAETLI